MAIHRIALVLSVALLVAPTLAADDSLAPVFHVRTADGELRTGPVERLQTDWSVHLGLANPRRIAGTEVLSLRRTDLKLPPYPTAEQVILTNGDRLVGTIGKLTGERLHVQATLHRDRRLDKDSDWIVPLSAVSVIWLAAPDGEGRADLLRRKLAQGSRRRDAVLLRNGDVLEGVLTALDRTDSKGSLRVEVDKKETTVDLAKVAAVALNTDLMQRLRAKGAYGHLVLANGCRLALASVAVDDRSLRGETLLGDTVRVAMEEVVALDLRNGRAVFLSDLKPRRYEFTPYLGSVQWPYVLDGSVTGGDLRLAKGAYDKGLGLHSGGRITYDLDGNYRRFEALVGLDDLGGKGGSVRLQVLVDGKSQDLGPDKDLTWKDGPRSIRVEVAGAKELTLAVDFGRFGDVQDHVDWVDAQLVK